MARKRPDPKEEALRAARALNPRPEAVTAPEFSASEFFDARDLVQVKYEMLRQARQDGSTVSDAAAAFGFSRPSFYEAKAAYEAGGHSRPVAQATRAEAGPQALRGRRRAAGRGSGGRGLALLGGPGRLGPRRVRCARPPQKRRACTRPPPKRPEGAGTMSARPAGELCAGYEALRATACGLGGLRHAPRPGAVSRPGSAGLDARLVRARRRRHRSFPSVNGPWRRASAAKWCALLTEMALGRRTTLAAS